MMTFETGVLPLVNLISKMRPDEIRASDLEEFDDACRALNYTDQEMYGPNFGEILCCQLGLANSDVSAYPILDSTGRLIFVASMYRERPDAPMILCGFATKYGDQTTDWQARMVLIESLFAEIIGNATDRYNVDSLICHVKSTNHETMRMWKVLSRAFRGSAFMNIACSPNPFIPGYTLVTINLKDPM